MTSKIFIDECYFNLEHIAYIEPREHNKCKIIFVGGEVLYAQGINERLFKSLEKYIDSKKIPQPNEYVT